VLAIVKMKSIFISDVHLQDADGPKTRAVLDFLRKKAVEVQHVFILGDLFDVWPGTTDFLISSFKPVTDTFKDLIRQGCQLHYIEGNHDFRLGKYFQKELGINVYPDSLELHLNQRKVFISHGDLGNPEEKAYRILRSILRANWLHYLIKPIPKSWIFLLGKKTSQLSRGYQSPNSEKEELIRETYRKTALELFEKGYDVVLMGHTHIPDDYKVKVGKRDCRYLNTGDWVRNFTYLEFDGIEFYTKAHKLSNI